MVKSKLVSYFVLVMCVLLGIELMVSLAFAESIFLKDGSIIEGDIVKETDKAMDVKLPDGKKMTIQRKDILRTLVSTSYKTKMYIMKNDKTVVPVYIVEEDNERYVCRKELQSAEEFVVLKEDVMFVSKVAPESIIDEKAKEIAKGKKEYTREQNILWRAPVLRLGYSNISGYTDNELSDAFGEGKTFDIILDFYPWHFRDKKGKGFDIMTRLNFYINEKIGLDPSDPTTQTYAKLFNVSSFSGEYEYHMGFLIANLGLQYSYNFYYGIGIEPYVFGLFQYVIVGENQLEDAGNSGWDMDVVITPSKYGYKLGGGVNIAFASYFGVFVEGVYGYIPMKFNDGKTRNIDGYHIYYGVTWRTSYGLIE
ncbi:MAG: hypothetical protein AB1444_15410 [Spirochaetota bacterium]